jgi:hypothetical protein
MTLNAGALNSAALNAEASAPVVIIGSGDTSLILVQSVGVSANDSYLVLLQSVVNNTGDTAISIAQSVFQTGNTALPIRQNGFSVPDVSYASWALSVMVRDVDISDYLIGEVTIDIERNAARLAEFTVLLSPDYSISSWIGQSITINYVQNDSASWRRFTGKIIEPVFNINDHSVTCRCSDDLQRVIDGMTNEDLLVLTGGFWSNYVFSEDAIGWQFLQDVLTTVSVSVELDSIGMPIANTWTAASAPLYSFDANIIDDGSVSVEIGQRNGLINRVEATFDARFERLYHKTSRAFFNDNATFCENYADPILFPTKSMVRDAVDAAGWTLLTENYTEVWPSGGYLCSFTPLVWQNTDSNLIRQFDITAAFRWQQSVTYRYTFTIIAELENGGDGDMNTEISGAADFTSSIDKWDVKGGAGTALPAGFYRDSDFYMFRDEIDVAALHNGLHTIIATGIETIMRSYRSNKVHFSMPLTPYLELSHTLEVDTLSVVAKGVIGRIKEKFVFDTGEATSEIELVISAGKSGADAIENHYMVPNLPVIPPVSGAPSIVYVPKFMGGKIGTAPLPADAWGVISNYEVQNPLAEIYPREIRMRFDGISDAKTQNKIQELANDISVLVPTNLLGITS